LISPIKFNIGAQRNFALKHATYDWILNIDAGTDIDKNYCSNMLGIITEYKDIDLVGGWVKAKKGMPILLCFVRMNFLSDRMEPYGASALYKKSIALSIGGYPEYLTYAAEDTVFFYKYQKLSKNWVFNKSAFILWDIPLGLDNVKHKLGRYFLGGFESGFWPYMYYQYILYPLTYKLLGRWAPNYLLFREYYKSYCKKASRS
jgi:glycosyltransferase involved in cell wall biosynthesis